VLRKLRIAELPIPTFYGDEVCHVNGMKYAWDIVAFFVTRIMLALGQFNYSWKGVLGIGHRRLFTFKSLRALLEQAGYEILEARGVPAPFPLAIGTNFWSRALLKVNQFLLKISQSLFAYQVCIRARALPDSRHLLKETISGSATLRSQLLARVA